MTNKEISSKVTDIITLNQQFFNNDINSKHLIMKLDVTMKDMSLEDLLILGYALTDICKQKEK